MLPELITIILWVPAFLGLGYWTSRALLPNRGNLHGGDYGMLGLVTALLAILAANFFVPVQPIVSSLLWITGIVGVVFYVRTEGLELSTKYLAGIALLGILLVLVGYGPFTIYDTGDYHLQSIRWTMNSKTPFGLANLYNRFGTSSALFVISSALPLPLTGDHPMLYLNLCVGFFFFYGFGREALKSDFPLPRTFAAVALLLLVLENSALAAVGSTSTDALASFLTLYAILLILRTEAGAALLVGSLGLMAKSSMLPMFLALFCIAVIQLHFFKTARRSLLVFGGLIWSAWLARSFILSGCLWFPHELSCTEVSWGVPRAFAKIYRLEILSYARDHSAPLLSTLDNWDWYSRWLFGFVETRTVGVTFLAIVASAIVLMFFKAMQKPIEIPKVILTLGAFSLVGLLFWFFSAPSPRFAHVPLMTLGIGIGCLPLLSVSRATAEKYFLLVVFLLILLVSKRVFTQAKVFPWQWEGIAIPAVRVKDTQARNGLLYWKPDLSEQCWDAPQPCSPIPAGRFQIHLGKTYEFRP